MRSAGFILAALLIAASVGLAQPPAVPGVPVGGQPGQPIPPPPPPSVKSDPKLDAYLGEWEKKMASVANVRMEIALKQTDVVFKKDTNKTGVVLCMKPNYAILRLDNVADKIDYEAYICDSKSLYAYNGLQRSVTKIDIAKNQSVDNLMMNFLSGMKAKEVKQRFDISLSKTDDYYIYLDIKPLRPSDQREFKQLRLALYGPGAATAKVAYLPAKVYMVKPNDDTEMWTFTNPQLDLPGVDAGAFKFSGEIPKGWKFQEAPQQPVGGPIPAGGALPPGTAVRPNK